ncbi:MAG: calcium-binding protein [Desulfovibrio sp.]|nr:calcium-binding protein [Desulfovibrio sp.]
MKKRILVALAPSVLLTLLLWGASSPAMPDMTGSAPADRFAASDTDASGSLSPEEFRKAFPGMRESAFGMIDKNGDDVIDRTEWDVFVKNHSAGTMGHGKSGGMAAPADRAVPLVTPPDGK